MTDFEYFSPKTISEAIKLLDKNSLIMAGGTDLLGMIKDEIVSPAKIINIKDIPELKVFDYSSRNLRIGSLITIEEINESKLIPESMNALKIAAGEIASPQLRTMGTLGGNLCQRPRCYYFRGDFDCIRKGGDTCFAYDGYNKLHCLFNGGPCFIVHPSDLAVALSVFDTKLKLFSEGKEKEIPFNQFFILPDVDPEKETILKFNDILTEVLVNNSAINKSLYIKVKEREAWDFALVSIALSGFIEGNKIKNGKIAFGGLSPAPLVINELNDKLNNFEINEVNIDNLTSKMFNDAYTLKMNEYKIQLAKNLIKKALTEII